MWNVLNLSLKSRKIQSTNNLKLIIIKGWTLWSTDFQISISNAAYLCDEFFYIGNGWHILGWSGILNLNISIYLTITLINFCWKRKPYDAFGKSRLRKSRQLLSLISRLSSTYNLSKGGRGYAKDVLSEFFSFYSLTQVHEETGILLIKPKDLIPRLEDIREDVKEIKEDDISAAANIPKLRAKLRKAELQAQVAAEKEPPLSDVEGTCATRERGQEASWKVGEKTL